MGRDVLHDLASTGDDIDSAASTQAENAEGGLSGSLFPLQHHQHQVFSSEPLDLSTGIPSHSDDNFEPPDDFYNSFDQQVMLSNMTTLSNDAGFPTLGVREPDFFAEPLLGVNGLGLWDMHDGNSS